MDIFWAVRLFCTKLVSFQLHQVAAANGKRCCVFWAGLFPIQPNIADQFLKNVAGPTQGLADGQKSASPILHINTTMTLIGCSLCNYAVSKQWPFGLFNCFVR